MWMFRIKFRILIKAWINEGLITVSLHPLAFETINEIVKKPGSLKVIVGFCCVDVIPLPKFHK